MHSGAVAPCTWPLDGLTPAAPPAAQACHPPPHFPSQPLRNLQGDCCQLCVKEEEDCVWAISVQASAVRPCLSGALHPAGRCSEDRRDSARGCGVASSQLCRTESCVFPEPDRKTPFSERSPVLWSSLGGHGEEGCGRVVREDRARRREGADSTGPPGMAGLRV